MSVSATVSVARRPTSAAAAAASAQRERDLDAVTADRRRGVGPLRERVDVEGGDGGPHDLAADERLELGGGAVAGDAAVVEDHDLVGEPVGFLQVLGGEHAPWFRRR